MLAFFVISYDHLPFVSTAGVYFNGIRAVWIIAISVVTCVLSEWIWQKAAKKPVRVSDLSAAVTGVILAMNLPASVPLWMPVVGGVFAIILVKQLFGGIGHNFLNPALAARAVLLASWPARMTTFWLPQRVIFQTGAEIGDAVTSATQLSGSKSFAMLDLFLGNVPGTIGETCKVAILIGLAIMLISGIVKWHIPVVFIGTVMIFSLIMGQDPLTAVLSGGVLFGAVYMATDYVTNPMLIKGRVIFAFGCGLIVVLIRNFGNYPEGVTYAILIMNIVTPLIDKYTKRRIYGEVKKNA